MQYFYEVHPSAGSAMKKADTHVRLFGFRQQTYLYSDGEVADEPDALPLSDDEPGIVSLAEEPEEPPVDEEPELPDESDGELGVGSLAEEPEVPPVDEDPEVPDESDGELGVGSLAEEPELPSVDDAPEVPDESEEELGVVPLVDEPALLSVEEPEVVPSLFLSSFFDFFAFVLAGFSESLVLEPEVSCCPCCSRISMARCSTSAAFAGSVLSRISEVGSCAYATLASDKVDIKTANVVFFIAISILNSKEHTVAGPQDFTCRRDKVLQGC
jgi:hypothetical protein